MSINVQDINAMSEAGPNDAAPATTPPSIPPNNPAFNDDVNKMFGALQSAMSGNITLVNDFNTIYNDLLSSPTAINEINQSQSQNLLKSFTYDTNYSNPPGSTLNYNSGAYDPLSDSMILGSNFVANQLFSQAVQSNAQLQSEDIASFFGHEMQHALDAPGIANADSQFAAAASSEAGNASELDSIIEDNVTANLGDEGSAAISGFNSAVDIAAAANGGQVNQIVINSAINNYGYLSTVESIIYNSDGSINYGAFDANGHIASSDQNIQAAGASFASLQPSGYPSDVTYLDKDTAYDLNVAEQESNNHTVSINTSDLELNNPSPSSGNSNLLTTDDVMQQLVDAGFNCGGMTSCAISNAADSSTTFFSFSSSGVFQGYGVVDGLSPLSSTNANNFFQSNQSDDQIDADVSNADLYFNNDLTPSININGVDDEVSVNQDSLTIQGNNNTVTATGGTIDAASGDTGETFNLTDNSGSDVTFGGYSSGAVNGAGASVNLGYGASVNWNLDANGSDAAAGSTDALSGYYSNATI
ncbi:hypothetical protein, partial [Rhodanobacter sp. ANJX3]|uniref:hypothetical protein n=1 Tax=Rhodanobacter sp. ANJX3 TaxID=2723083 RepID=UPI00160C2BAA